MLRVTIDVNAPADMAQGIKEFLAMIVEYWGDTRVVSVEEIRKENKDVRKN